MYPSFLREILLKLSLMNYQIGMFILNMHVLEALQYILTFRDYLYLNSKIGIIILTKVSFLYLQLDAMILYRVAKHPILIYILLFFFLMMLSPRSQ